MRVVVAMDKLKGSLDAHAAATRLAEGITAAAPGVEVTCVPVADGGEGTLDAAVCAGYGLHDVIVEGPTGEPVHAALAVRGHRAVVELAAASGLALLPAGVPAPRTASSHGTGELLLAALDLGCTDVVLAVGGSASTDGGAGLLTALGARFLDAQGHDLPRGGVALSDLHALRTDALDARTATTRITLASDVDTVLLGAHGAAAVFGPQKGADDQDVRDLDAGLARLGEVVARDLGHGAAAAARRPGSGAAGGAGFAALALLGAVRRPGIDVVLELVGLDRALAGADLVITGEGSIDAQTLAGKAPLGVARAARRAGVPVVAVCGVTSLDDTQLTAAGFDRTYTLSELEPDVARSMTRAADLLKHVGSTIAAHLPRLTSTEERPHD